ncbi:MAG: type II secretion system F family protein [Bacteroidales bacterium]|nr:type II secretion system F family protein [Lachnoclostridium sp.]MCM1385067.1 type II secretion system F family protein [Lachnoclostridium sp.]MCM1465301.1 type II secretion system F family protein [Bacteroidales bacterium]
MAAYGYEALDGAGKKLKGSIEAEDLEQARQELKKQGLTVLDVKKQSALTKDLNIEIGGYPTPRDMSVFCRQFTSMSRAGVTLLDTLKMLSEQTENDRLREAVEKLRISVEKGDPLSRAMEEQPKIFSSLLIKMVAAGEASGSLDVALERMSTQFEKDAKTKALVKKAMMYPIMVIAVTIVVVIVMLTVVIPNYTSMFADLGTELPAITKMVQSASNFIIHRWFILLPTIIVIVLGIRAYAMTDQGIHVIHKLQLKIPMFRNLTVKQSSSQVARTMSTLMAAGVPLIETVGIVAETMSNVYFKEALRQCKSDIMVGQPLSRPMESCGLFPPMVYHMTRIGEETGNTEEMLTKLADYYDEEVEVAVQTFMAALEPMIIVVLAAVVLVMVGACMAPMLTMYQALDSL